MFINKIVIKEIEKYIFDKIDLKIAEIYVHHFDMIQISETNGILHIEAILHTVNKNYNCFLDLKNNEIVAFGCNCSNFKNSFFCPHLIALTMKLNEFDISMLPFEYIDKKAVLRENALKEKKQLRWQKKKNKMLEYGRNLMSNKKQLYEQNLLMASVNKDYEIESILNNDYGLHLTFKVGQNKKYVIKNIPEFIDRINHQRLFSYGKNLEFVHQYEAFNSDGKKQIDFMKAHLGEFNRTNYYDSVNEKYFNLEGQILDDFFDQYQEIEASFSLAEIDASIRLKVSELDDMIVIEYNDDNSYINGAKHLYTFDEDCLIRYRMDEGGKAVTLIQSLLQNPVYILKSEYGQFYKYVLSDILSYFDIKGMELLEETVDPCSMIKLYGDIDDQGEMYVKLEYYNESGNFMKGFDENNLIGYKQDLVETYIRKYASVIDMTNHIAYFDSESEDTFEFVSEGLPYLAQYCEIFVSDALRNLGKKHNYSVTVGVRFENNLLEIDVDSLQIPKQEIGDVLNAYRRKRKFYRLKNGKLIVLNSEQLEELDDLLDTYHLSGKDLHKGSISMPSYRLFSLNEKAETAKNITINRSKSFKKQLDHFADVNKEYQLSEHYDHILRDYQKAGYKWLSMMRDYGFNGILADDMGLGKTLQVIALLDEKQCEKPSIVVCPASLIYNWEDEIHKFSKRLKALCICGNATLRQVKIKQSYDYDILITSYDYMRRDVDLYEGMSFDTIVLDEAQNIKNQKTKNAISVKKLHGDHKIALTGTPIENTLAELWSIFDFLMPNYLFNYHYFLSHYENDIVKNHDEEKQRKLKGFVSPFILRRNKKDVLKELPEKIEKVQLIEFSEEEYKIYLANLAKVNSELAELTKTESNDKIAILAMLTRLRQLCCEPRLMYDNINNSSSKMKACMELIHNFHANQQKILLFSSFTSMLDLIEDELYKEGISYYKLTGQTSKEDRKLLVDKFQNDDTAVFLISLKAGGTGLNLTAAEAVIHYDPWWNQSAQNQATDRAYRFGQDKKVQVFKLVMKNSIEEKIQKLQLMKKELADTFVENNEGSIAKMSKEDLMELFTME